MAVASPQRTALQDIDGWPDGLVRALADKGIRDAEQVVAIAATPGGLDSLAIEMGVTPDETRRLVALARDQLTPEEAAALEEPVPDRGLGAVQPPRRDDGP